MESNPDLKQKPFRVIIVGAGIVGLSLSHALQLANIDHVVLEKHKEIVSLRGSALILFPCAARILDQFGILKRMRESTTPVEKEFIRWPDGTINVTPSNHSNLRAHFGVAPVALDRHKVVRYLYEGLPDQSAVRTGARVERIVQSHAGVRVFLDDGSCEAGDIVVGADGVHSLTRQFMWEHAARTDPGLFPASDKSVAFTEYKAIYGASDPHKFPSLGQAEVHLCLDYGTSKLVFTQPGALMWAFIYKDEYSQPPKPYRPDEKETEEVAARFKHLKITEDITFEDLWVHKTRAGILNMEEGILEKWHAGRIVLVGDSAHKMTADLGMGANMGIESAAALANTLYGAVAAHSNRDYHPTTPELSALFTEYQSERHARVKEIMELSGSTTRMRSYDSVWKRIFVSRIATISIVRKVFFNKMVVFLSKAPKLEYVKVQTIDENLKGWRLGQKKNEKSTGDGRFMVVLLLFSFGLAISSYTVLR